MTTLKYIIEVTISDPETVDSYKDISEELVLIDFIEGNLAKYADMQIKKVDK